MAASIEVCIAGRGLVRGGTTTPDASVRALCDLCNTETDAVVSVGSGAVGSAAAGSAVAGPFACKDCLRQRLEAITVATWMMRDPAKAGLPWGKVSG